jgi:putative redox protein
MSDTLRSVMIERTGSARYVVGNERGGSISVSAGEGADFTPVELLLAAIGCCSAIDVDLITGKRAQPTEFSVRVIGDKVRDEAGSNRMVNLAVEFTVRFAEGEAGDKARGALPRAVSMSHDRLCTVSRTVELGTPISVRTI